MHNEYEQYITEKTNALKPDIDRVKRFASSIESHNLLQHLADAGSKQTALNIKASALALRMTDRDVFALNEPALSRLTELTRSLEAVLEHHGRVALAQAARRVGRAARLPTRGPQSTTAGPWRRRR